jgi:multiple sugar transport system permease protein
VARNVQSEALEVARSPAVSIPLLQGRAKAGSALFRRRSLTGFIFVLPAVAFLLGVIVLPILFNFWLSLHAWNPLSDLSAARWVGFQNYEFLFNIDTRFKEAFINSFIYAGARVIANVVLGLGLALLLNDKRIRWLRFWRIALFLPIATSPAVMAKIWTALYHKDFGIINAGLEVFGIPASGWLTNPSSALLAIIIMGVYQYVGYYAIIFLAALQSIPQELVDAGRVDGASGFRLLWYIILPQLRPVIGFVVVISTIYGLQVFDHVWASTGGGPANATNTVVLQMYRTVFTNGRAGQGAAMAFVLFAVIMILAVFQLYLLRRRS